MQGNASRLRLSYTSCVCVTGVCSTHNQLLHIPLPLARVHLVYIEAIAVYKLTLGCSGFATTTLAPPYLCYTACRLTTIIRPFIAAHQINCSAQTFS